MAAIDFPTPSEGLKHLSWVYTGGAWVKQVVDLTFIISASSNWESTYTTVSSNSAIWGGAGSGDFCSTTVLLNEVSACGGEMSVDGTLSASDMITTTLTADGVYFNTGANRPPELGELVWDETERTLDLGLENGVVLQIGEEQLINVIAGEEIKDGQVVYASGAFSQGNTGKIVASLYSASSAEGVSPGAVDELFFIGVATQDIAQDASGYITTFGKVRNINVYDGSNVNTDIVGPDNVGIGSDPDWEVGRVLYISTSAGRLTNTPPESPNKIIPAAMVISQSGNGHQRTLFVRQEHGYHIDELHDVRVINPQQNDVLAFNSTLSSWDNVTSNNWESTFTTVSTNSADWVTYSTNNISVANWVLDEDNLSSNDDTKVPTQQSVKFYIDNVVTGINNLKGGYEADTDTPQLDTIPTTYPISAGDTYYITESGLFFDQQVDPGDLIISTTDGASALSSWVIVNRNIQDELIDRWNSTYTTVTAESANWDSTYTTVSANSADWADHFDSTFIETKSANWESTYTTVSLESGNWDSTYTTVSSNSATWGIDTVYDDSALQAASGNWNSTYTTVSSNSASWADHFDSTFIETESANWDSTYTTVSTESANWIGGDYDDSALQAASGNWNSTYTTVSTNSASWLYDDSALQAASGDWDSAYTTVSSNSASWADHFDSTLIEVASSDWNSTYTTVLAESSNWDSTHTTVSTNSADWVTYSSNSIYPEASWVIDEDTFTSNLSSKVPTQQSVKAYVDGIVTGINNLKGGYDAGTNTPNLDSPPTVTIQQGDSYYVTASGDFFTIAVDPGDLLIATIDNATLSGDWVIVNRNIQDELIDRWNSTHTTVSANSANWESTYTTVGTNSANWNSTYTTVFTESANWDSTYTTVLAESATWSDTSTVVQNNSGIWDNSAALAYNDGASNSIEIGLLDSTTQTGDYAITIQGRRSFPDKVASGDYSMAIGRDSKATGNSSIAIGSYATATGVRSVAIGYGANSSIPVPLSAGENSIAIGTGFNYATGNRAIAIGESAQATGFYSAAFGNINNVTGYSSIAFGAVNKVTGNYSAAFGTNIALSSNDVAEFGMWGNFASSRKRHGAVRCSGNYDSPIDTHYFHVCITALSSQAPLQGGGSVQGNEPSNTIPRNMYTIRRWGNDVYLDANDSADNITTIQLGGGGGNVVETVTSNTYTQPTTTTHTIYNDDDVSVTQDIVATLMNPADHTGTTVHKKIGSSHNVVITPPIGSTIDGAASFTLQFENESVSIFSDGTNFFIA